MLGARSLPTNVILANLTNKANALQNICDIVDTTFLYVQSFYSLIQVNSLLWGFLQQVDKLLC